MKQFETSDQNILEVTEYSNLSNLFKGKLYTEDDCCFKINKKVLAKKSKYFEALFYGFFSDKTKYVIPGVSGECLHEILLYLYTDKITLNSKNALDIWLASDYFMIKNTVIKEKVKNVLTIDNSLQLLLLSDLLNDTVVFQDCFRFIQVNFEEIMSTQKDDITYLSFENLKSLLTTRNLRIHSERTTWLAIEAWVEKRESERKIYVPALLKCLALEDLDENLATLIIGHNLIMNNSHVQKLSSAEESTSRNYQHLKSIVQKNNPDLINDVFSRRIPESLHIIAEIIEDTKSFQLYVTYDENLDQWRRIVALAECPHLVNIEHNLYIFSHLRNEYMKMDLRDGLSVHVNALGNMYGEISSALLKNRVYVLIDDRFNTGSFNVKTCSINIFDCTTNSWSINAARFTILSGQCVSVGKFIYVVGSVSKEIAMTTYVFDTTPPRWFDFRAHLFPQSRWKEMPGPAIFRHRSFHLVLYHNKIFIFGGYDRDFKKSRSVEALNLESHIWTRLEDLPFVWALHSELHRVILNDRLFVFDTLYEINSKIAVWDDDHQRWIKLGAPETCKWVQGFQIGSKRSWRESSVESIQRRLSETPYHKFCTITDTDAISALFKENKMLPIERSHFSEKNTFVQDWFSK